MCEREKERRESEREMVNIKSHKCDNIFTNIEIRNRF